MKKGSSEIAKKQEVGRGLRLPVNVFKQELMDSGIIDKNSLASKNAEQTAKLISDFVFDNPILEEHREKITEEFISIKEQKGSNKINITNGDNESYKYNVRAFVTEDEFKELYANLSDVEKYKIKCGILHFKAVSDLIQFEWVSSCDDFKTKFGVTDTI